MAVAPVALHYEYLPPVLLRLASSPGGGLSSEFDYVYTPGSDTATTGSSQAADTDPRSTISQEAAVEAHAKHRQAHKKLINKIESEVLRHNYVLVCYPRATSLLPATRTRATPVIRTTSDEMSELIPTVGLDSVSSLRNATATAAISPVDVQVDVNVWNKRFEHLEQCHDFRFLSKVDTHGLFTQSPPTGRRTSQQKNDPAAAVEEVEDMETRAAADTEMKRITFLYEDEQMLTEVNCPVISVYTPE